MGVAALSLAASEMVFLVLSMIDYNSHLSPFTISLGCWCHFIDGVICMYLVGEV